ncbi:MAG: DUF1499 domain-containing protein [Acidobacteria bacterium]|nr:DUF1499 domain-containing protein [Acidobacteriota bacterium]
MKKKLLIIVAIVLVPLVAILIIARVFYPDNVAETSPDGGPKHLVTRYYRADPDSAERAVREVIPTLSTYGSNWKLADAGARQENQIVIKAEVPVVVFTDDLQVTINYAGDSARVNVRSASRVGKSDFGENRRHVAKFLDALDKKLQPNPRPAS